MTQMRGDGVSMTSLEKTSYGALAYMKHGQKEYISIFISPSHRGKGLYEKIQKKENKPIITTPDCLVEAFLIRKKIPYKLVGLHQNTDEYKMISSYYGNKKASRSKVFLMNHIDEGISVLKKIKASENAIKAYCLHPILQSDEDLSKNFKDLEFWGDSPEAIQPKVLILAMEYRSVANEYLSKRKISSIDEIRLSPLKDVNDMLIADKVQNYKDFLLHHKESHSRSKELDEYFNNWFKRLGVNYNELVKVITG